MENRFIEAVVKELQTDEGVFVASVSSGKKDRMGDILNPDGWELTNYRKNPVILWAHNQFEPPVAKADKVWVEDKELKIKGKWAPIPFAQELRKLVEGGFLNALSVGFMPLKEPQATKEGGFKFESQELLEISWVNVPALPSALVAARKLQLPLLTKALEDLENIEIKPYPNEHSCRLESPDKYKRFRRNNCFRKHDGKCIDYIWGVRDEGGEEVTELQAMRYPKDEWSEDDARSHCKDAGGSFEAASDKNQLQGACSKYNEKMIDLDEAKNLISKVEEATTALKEMFNLPKDGSALPADKGRKQKKTDVGKDEYEAELIMISAVDKAMEILRHRLLTKIRQQKTNE